MAHTLYGMLPWLDLYVFGLLLQSVAYLIFSGASSRARMRGNDVMFRSGTQPCTPHEHPSWQPMPRTSQGPLVAPLHRLDEVAAAWPEEQAHHVDTLLNDDKGRSAKFACATEGSDVAVLQSQVQYFVVQCAQKRVSQ